jgi:sulfite exporter TauE/SafE
MTPMLESFVFGAANSVHCACMCGPLSLAFHGEMKSTSAYQLGRLLANGALGVVLGGIGAAFGTREVSTPSAWVAFVLAAALVLLALIGERGAMKLPGIGRLVQMAMTRTRALPPMLRSGALGALPPCSRAASSGQPAPAPRSPAPPSTAEQR